MPLQTTILNKGLSTHMAPIPPVVRMNSHMVFKCLQSGVSLLAHFTLEVAFSRVSGHVVVQGETGEELLTAELAFIPVVFQMILPPVYGERSSSAKNAFAQRTGERQRCVAVHLHQVFQLLRVRHQFHVALGAEHAASLVVHPVDVEVPVILRFKNLPASLTRKIPLFMSLLMHHEPALIHKPQPARLTHVITKMLVHMFVQSVKIRKHFITQRTLLFVQSQSKR